MNTLRDTYKGRAGQSRLTWGVSIVLLVAVGMAVLWPVFSPEWPIHRPPKLGPVAWDGNTTELKRLLAAGADVDARGWMHRCRYIEKNATALHFAALGGQPEAAEVLLAAGASVKARTEYGFAPLHLAAQGGNDQIAKMLLDAGAAVSDRDSSGRTPLHMAAEYGSVAVARVLLDAGANTNTKADYGGTPLGYARRYSSSEAANPMIELLQEYDDIK